MTHKDKVDLIAGLREELLAHPVFAKKMVRYIEFLMEEHITDYDVADNWNQIATIQGKRKMGKDIIDLLEGKKV